MSINGWVAVTLCDAHFFRRRRLLLPCVFGIGAILKWIYDGKVYAWLCRFLFDFRISKLFFSHDFFLSLHQHRLFIPSEEFIQWAFHSASFWFALYWHFVSVFSFFNIAQTKSTYTDRELERKKPESKSECGFIDIPVKFFFCFLCVSRQKNYVISISLSFFACAQAIVWSLFLPQNEHTKWKRKEEEKMLPHRIIAPLAANQQQEKYGNIKKREEEEEDEKYERICLETVQATENQREHTKKLKNFFFHVLCTQTRNFAEQIFFFFSRYCCSVFVRMPAMAVDDSKYMYVYVCESLSYANRVRACKYSESPYSMFGWCGFHILWNTPASWWWWWWRRCCEVN